MKAKDIAKVAGSVVVSGALLLGGNGLAFAQTYTSGTTGTTGTVAPAATTGTTGTTNNNTNATGSTGTTGASTTGTGTVTPGVPNTGAG
ncbi:MAG TPA: hypothetical protein VN665_00945, partial [Candidatus Paceibacterota bacterium]|nr:hypothetical protein [Candidatus Paceibacterota bacterium]